MLLRGRCEFEAVRSGSGGGSGEDGIGGLSYILVRCPIRSFQGWSYLVSTKCDLVRNRFTTLLPNFRAFTLGVGLRE